MDSLRKQFASAFHRVQSKVKLLDALERGVLEESGDKALRIVQKIRSSIAIQKVEWTVDMAIKYFKFSGPTIIFSEFIEPLNEIGRLLKGQGYSSVKAIGKGMKMAEREWNIKDFKDGKHEFLLATFGAMSEGENLQYARNIIFNDLSWQPLVIKQATRRVWRIGQANECHVTQMLCSADATVQRIVSDKQEMVGKFEEFLVDIKQENGYI